MKKKDRCRLGSYRIVELVSDSGKLLVTVTLYDSDAAFFQFSEALRLEAKELVALLELTEVLIPNKQLREQIDWLNKRLTAAYDRIVAQSELLSRAAEKQPRPGDPGKQIPSRGQE